MTRYIHENKDGSYRDSTEEEIEEAEKLQKIRDYCSGQIKIMEKQIKSIHTDCKHIVSYDEDCYPYTARVCVACGKVSYL